ncbi:MAG: HlyD family efflux transporter periplasmic adaptor subunit [Bacteroidetes bacterium]|nr:HlyD family efflux transporter periplasmic adaptor subunit [Bacteroidota bacterium]
MKYFRRFDEREELVDLINSDPSWFIRWGSTALFTTVFLLIGLSFFIKYPDKIPAQVVITTEVPPTRIVARSEGKVFFLTKNNQSINEGDILGYIENSASVEDALFLIAKLKFSSDSLITESENSKLSPLYHNLNLGTIQEAYSNFYKSVKELLHFKHLNKHKKKIDQLEYRIKLSDTLQSQFKSRIKTLAEKLHVYERKFQIDSKLFHEKVISEIDFDLSYANYLEIKLAYQQAIINSSQNSVLKLELLDQIESLKIEQITVSSNLELVFQEAHKNLKSKLAEWKQLFLLEAPIKGKVSLGEFWSNNQYIKKGDNVLSIIPETNNIFGIIKMPILGSGKVRIGQRVNLRFDNYPFTEFGMVIGKIKSISLVPSDGLYTIILDLPNKLATSNNRTLEFKQEMKGEAEIITKDYRLIERVINKFRSNTDNIY